MRCFGCDGRGERTVVEVILDAESAGFGGFVGLDRLDESGGWVSRCGGQWADDCGDLGRADYSHVGDGYVHASHRSVKEGGGAVVRVVGQDESGAGDGDGCGGILEEIRRAAWR